MEIQTSGESIDTLMEEELCICIIQSGHYIKLYRWTYYQVIDEIFNEVNNVKPWMPDDTMEPSPAFCLLYKFFTLKLTVKQIQGLLKNYDSLYIRAIGFLYLRYVADPKTLWAWYEPYLKDNREFSPGSNGRFITMGVYVRDLILGQYYFDSMLPKVPRRVIRQVTANLEKMSLPTNLSGLTGVSRFHGSEDTASWFSSVSISSEECAPERASTSHRRRSRSRLHGKSKLLSSRQRSRSRCHSSSRNQDTGRSRCGRDCDRGDREHVKCRHRGSSSRHRSRTRSPSSSRDQDIDHSRRDQDCDRGSQDHEHGKGRHRGSSSRHRSKSRSDSSSRNQDTGRSRCGRDCDRGNREHVKCRHRGSSSRHRSRSRSPSSSHDQDIDHSRRDQDCDRGSQDREHGKRKHRDSSSGHKSRSTSNRSSKRDRERDGGSRDEYCRSQRRTQRGTRREHRSQREG